MKKILEEILFDTKKAELNFLILTFQLTLCFFLCIFSEQLKTQIEITKSEVIESNSEKKYYNIVDNLVGDYEIQFFEEKDALGKLKIMYSLLANSNDFKYLEIYKNSIVMVGEDIKDESLYAYEIGEAENYRVIESGQVLNEVKSYWISTNVAEEFEFKFETGSLWNEEEKNNVVVPIVLGSDYAETYSVGDTIGGITPTEGNVQFQVYGILEEGSHLIFNNRMENIDRYVLIPLKDVLAVPENNDEESKQKILYLFKINGMLQSNLPVNELQKLVLDICNKSSITPASSVMGATNAQSYIINASMLNVLELLVSMLFMLAVFAVITTLLYMLIKIEKNKRYYAILSINGFSMNQIRGILLGNILLPVVLADFVAIIIGLFLSVILDSGNIPLTRLIAVNTVLVLVSFGASCIKIKYLNISNSIGGGE